MLVDLAGSERLKDSAQNRQETATINKSLFCLGKVVNALSERNTDPAVHVPYRDSVLTKLLMEGLGGDALTLLITCCSPCDVHVEETLNTLMYAQKAKGILTGPPVVHAPEGKTELMALRKEVKDLREQNTELRSRLEAKDAKDNSDVNHPFFAPQSVPQSIRHPYYHTSVTLEDPYLKSAKVDRLGPPCADSHELDRTKGGGNHGDTILEEIMALKNKLQNLEHKLTDRKFLSSL